MGGIGTGLSIEAAEPPAGKKRSTPRALHTAISRAVMDAVWKNATSAFRPTAGDYLAQERSDAGERDLWSASPTELGWAFMDHAGCCSGSSYACYHWFDVALDGWRDRWDKMAAGRGWRITTPPAVPGGSWFSGRVLLAAAGGRPFVVRRLPIGQIDWADAWDGPSWDDGSPSLAAASPDPAGRDAVLRAGMTGLCGCGLCARLRPFRGWATGIAALEAVWRALPEPDLAPLVREAAAAVRGPHDWREVPAGPPAVQVLSDAVGERLSARVQPWELAGMATGV